MLTEEPLLFMYQSLLFQNATEAIPPYQIGHLVISVSMNLFSIIFCCCVFIWYYFYSKDKDFVTKITVSLILLCGLLAIVNFIYEPWWFFGYAFFKGNFQSSLFLLNIILRVFVFLRFFRHFLVLAIVIWTLCSTISLKISLQKQLSVTMKEEHLIRWYNVFSFIIPGLWSLFWISFWQSCWYVDPISLEFKNIISGTVYVSIFTVYYTVNVIIICIVLSINAILLQYIWCSIYRHHKRLESILVMKNKMDSLFQMKIVFSLSLFFVPGLFIYLWILFFYILTIINEWNPPDVMELSMAILGFPYALFFALQSFIIGIALLSRRKNWNILSICDVCLNRVFKKDIRRNDALGNNDLISHVQSYDSLDSDKSVNLKNDINSNSIL